MWQQFYLTNAHFASNLFVAFVLFAVAWLYFDAWLVRKSFKEIFKILGFLFLVFSFVVHATYMETAVIQVSLLGVEFHRLLLSSSRIIGYLLLLVGLSLEPLQPRPTLGIFGLPPVVLGSTAFLYPILAAGVALLYLRRATIGLERHIRSISLAFFLFSLFELLSLFALFRETDNILIYNLVAPFGPIWIIEHLVLLIGSLVLGRWVFRYLLKRFQTQLFMIFTVTILVIFLLTTVVFTTLLLKNFERETLSQLEIDGKVLHYAIESKKAESISDIQVFAQNQQVQSAVSDKSRTTLFELAQNSLLNKRQNFLVITNENGEVLARGEDKERVGDSLSGDSLIKRALLGETVSSITTKDGVLASEVSVRAAAPVKLDGSTIGAVMTGMVIDNAFVDGIKKATGLPTAIYGDNQLSATTMVAPDGRSRLLGIKEENAEIKNRVLAKGESFVGGTSILNSLYFAAYLPLKDMDNNIVGMLFVGKPQLTALEAAGYSIELTFIITAILLVLSVIPSYLISKYITHQIR